MSIIALLIHLRAQESTFRHVPLTDLIVESVRQPENPHVHHALAERYLALGELFAAESALRRSLALQPEAGNYRTLGAVLATMGRDHEALVAFDQSLRLDPDMWQTYRQRGLLRLNRKEYLHAVRDFRNALKIKPREASLCLEAGRAFLSARIEEDTMQSLHQYLRQRPHDAEGHAMLGTAHLEFGRFDSAEAALKNAVALDSNNTLAHRSMARLYLKQSTNLEQGLKHVKRAAELEPHDGEVFWEMGQVLLRLNKPKEAALQLEKAVRLEPQSYQAFYTLGVAYDRAGNRNMASQAFAREKILRRYNDELMRLRTVLQANPDNVESRLELARWHRRAGNYHDAIQEYQVILHANVDDHNKQVAARELQELQSNLSQAQSKTARKSNGSS